MPVGARWQPRYVQYPVTYLHSGVVSGGDRGSSVGLDVLFEQAEPQVHLFLVATVDDDGIKADTCNMFKNGKCNWSLSLSAFSRQHSGMELNRRELPSICFLRAGYVIRPINASTCSRRPTASETLLDLLRLVFKSLGGPSSHTQLTQE